ncbi:MAG TPA: hypothetical protein VN688_34300 [Gemmataceae bacterium]|nr:hypothetical protein [Gemmataceae bacterium]
MREQIEGTTIGRLTSAALAIFLIAGGLDGAEPRADQPRSSVVGQLVSAEGSLFQRTKAGQPWQTVPSKGKLHAGDLLFGLPGAIVETSKGAVRLELLTDMDKNSPYPIFEAAVRLHDSPNYDLDFTLDRGRVDVTNTKTKGSARVRIRFHGQMWDATLHEPGARIALELYGRWPKGVRFTPEPGPKDVPAADLLLLVRKGNVDVKHDSKQHALSAPPGPALLHWDNRDEAEEAPHKLDKLPAWADTEDASSERALRIKKVVEEFRREAVKSSLKEALDRFANSEDPNHRASGVIFMGAADDLEGLAKVLMGTKYPDAWDWAVVVIRHWIGRAPGQDQIVYRMLVNKRKMPVAQAQSIMQLLHSFDDTVLAQPELYKMLVKFLDHDRMGIRGLAHWHLSRLVPAGKKIGFNPLDPKEKRDKARDQWKKLIDDMLAKGQLPPKDLPK